MKEKPLTKTNRFLKDVKRRKKLLTVAVNSSSAIEGISYRISSKTKKTRKTS